MLKWLKKNKKSKFFTFLHPSMEKQLKDPEAVHQYYQKIISCMPNNVYWLNRECITLGCNDNILKLIGLNSLDEFVGITYEEMGKLAGWTEGQAESFKKDDMEVMSTGLPKYNVEEPPLYDEQNNPVYYISSRVPIFNGKEVVGVVGISVDATKQKYALEREKIALSHEEELRRAVMVLSGSIVHDLRTPIAILQMNAKELNSYLPALIEAYQKAEQANLTLDKKMSKNNFDNLMETFQTIKETSKKMNDFIDSTLKTLSKVLGGELRQEDLVACSMWHCIDSTLKPYPFKNEQRNLIKYDRKDFKFMGNNVLMIRILTNLMNNSLQQIEKNKKGEIIISIEEMDNFNVLRFKDTAGGASPEIVQHLFDGYKTTKEKGTGVGLAFCKLTMESFGGNMEGYSVYGDYIEFLLKFPKIETL